MRNLWGDSVTGAVAALVPMRHQSIRVPGKNYRSLNGIPLYHYILRTLLMCPSIHQVVIDTDSPVIKEDAARNFPQVRLLDRPEHLRADTVAMTEVLAYDDSQVQADVYVQTHSTNPFLKTTTIERALAEWRGSDQHYDSLFTVQRLQGRLWDSTSRPVNHNPWILLRTQDLPPFFIENSNLYIFRAELLRSSRRRIGDRPRLFEMDPIEAIDIDDEAAFCLAEAMLSAGVAV